MMGLIWVSVRQNMFFMSSSDRKKYASSQVIFVTSHEYFLVEFSIELVGMCLFLYNIAIVSVSFLVLLLLWHDIHKTQNYMY